MARAWSRRYVGFVTGLTAIYLVDREWRKGGGTMLMQEAARAMGRNGYTRATLWVLEGNLRARQFYEARGWTPDGAVRVESRASIELREVRSSRPLAFEN